MMAIPYPLTGTDPYYNWRRTDALCREACALFGWSHSACYPTYFGRGYPARLPLSSPDDPRGDWFRERGWEIERDRRGWLALPPTAG